MEKRELPTKEAMINYIENFSSKKEYQIFLNALAYVYDDEILKLLKECELKEYDILKLMSAGTSYRFGGFSDRQKLTIIRINCALKRLEATRINDLINAIKQGIQEKYLETLSVNDKEVLISFIKNREESFEHLDEYNAEIFNEYESEMIRAISLSILANLEQKQKEPDKQKTL